jgi:hypothetical protein
MLLVVALLSAFTNHFFTADLSIAFKGLIFGLITGAYFTYLAPISKKGRAFFAWVFISAFTWILAAITTVLTSPKSGWLPDPQIYNFMLGSVVAAYILVVGFNYFFKEMDTLRKILIPLASSAIFFFFPALTDSHSMNEIPLSQDPFFIWPLVMTLLLGSMLLTRNNNQEITVPTNGLPSR